MCACTLSITWTFPWFRDPRQLPLVLIENRRMRSHTPSGPENTDPEAGNGTDESHQFSCPLPPPFFFFWPHGMWDLSFPTKDWTHAPGIGSTEFQPLACWGSPGRVLRTLQDWRGGCLGLRGEAPEARMVGVVELCLRSRWHPTLLFQLQAPGWQHLLHLSRSLEVSLVVRSKQRAMNVRVARGAFPEWGLSGACSQVSGCGFSHWGLRHFRGGSVGSPPQGISTASGSSRRGSWLPPEWTSWKTTAGAIMLFLT